MIITKDRFVECLVSLSELCIILGIKPRDLFQILREDPSIILNAPKVKTAEVSLNTCIVDYEYFDLPPGIYYLMPVKGGYTPLEKGIAIIIEN